MKATILILSFVFATSLLGNGQVNYGYSDNFSAICGDTDDSNYSQKLQIYIQNDSIIIEDVICNQCCPEFALKISDIVNDSLYVSFSDTTTTMMCDCMCDFSVTINAGKTNSTDIRINYNGNWYSILPEDYMPLVEVGKRWNTLRLIPGLENTLPTHIEYSIESEQLHAFCWNGKKYYEIKGKYITNGDYVNPTDTVSNYIREENGKVFLLDPSQIYLDGCEEALIYDFNAKVGDTLTLGFDSVKYVVVPIGTSMIQGRRIIALADLTEPELSNYAVWIEGIGDTRGLLMSKESLYICGAMNVLTCCYMNDDLIYKNSNYPDCGIRPRYMFFIEEGKKWTTVINCFLENDTSYKREIAISKENMIDNLYAMRFYPYSDTTLYFQEENGRVYFNDEENRFLIYDFTLQPDDSVIVGYPDDHLYHLKVDSVKFLKYQDDNLRKTLFISGDITTKWIEGIGDINAPLDYWMELPPNGCVPDFGCCSLNSGLLYQNPLYPNCGETTSINPVISNQISIYPNPASDRLNIDGVSDNQLDYQIINSTGRIIQEGVLKTEIKINLVNGIYILLIKEKNNIVKTEKLIINCP
jgi:hypothetical protein